MASCRPLALQEFVEALQIWSYPRPQLFWLCHSLAGTCTFHLLHSGQALYKESERDIFNNANKIYSVYSAKVGCRTSSPTNNINIQICVLTCDIDLLPILQIWVASIYTNTVDWSWGSINSSTTSLLGCSSYNSYSRLTLDYLTIGALNVEVEARLIVVASSCWVDSTLRATCHSRVASHYWLCPNAYNPCTSNWAAYCANTSYSAWEWGWATCWDTSSISLKTTFKSWIS